MHTDEPSTGNVLKFLPSGDIVTVVSTGEVGSSP